MLERFGARAIGAAIFAAFLLGLIVFGVTQCEKRRSLGAQNRVTTGQTGALANSSADAVDTVGNAAARERTSDDLTRSNEQEIRNAEGANAPVNPAARDAGLRALCVRPAYRDSERCRLLSARPR